MQTLSVLPFAVMFIVGLAAMAGQPVYKICRRGIGTARIDAHLVKPSAWSMARAVFRRVVAAWRQAFARWMPLAAALVLAVVLAHAFPHAAEGAGMAIVAPFSLKALTQAEADNNTAIRKLKAEARTLFTAAERTPEQTARLDAITKTELTALEEKAETLAADLATARRLQDDEKKAPTERIEVRERAEDKPATLGEVMQAMAYQAYRSTGRSDRASTILPNGISAHVIAAVGGPEALMAAASGASSGVPESGGLLVRNEWNTSLLDKVATAGTIAPKCFTMPIGEGNDGVEAPYIDETSRATGSRWGGVQVYRGAEAAAMTAAQPKFGKFELRLEDLFGLFYATDRVLRDATLLESIATKAFTSEFAFRLDDEICRGTGAGQCLGIFGNAPTVSVAKETNQGAATVVYENIIKMHARLLARCMSGAEWYINQMLLPQLNKMYVAVGTGGVPVYLPANGVSAAPYGTLMGLPVNVIEQASAPGTVGDITLANFSNDYALISKAMTSASSIHVLFTSNQTTFRWVWPVIGKPVMASAITPYKGSDTLGPFVTLATRA